MNYSGGAAGYQLKCCNNTLKQGQTIVGVMRVLVGGWGSLFTHADVM